MLAFLVIFNSSVTTVYTWGYIWQPISGFKDILIIDI